MSHDVFISHSSIDKTIADAATAALEQAQIRCWIAPRDILPGESWGGSIVDAIEASKVMVMVFSSNSNDSKQVMREVERAVQKDVVVVPFRVEAVEPSRDMEYFLSATHWLDAITPEMDDHLQDLVGTVQALLNKSDDAPRPVKKKVAAAPAAPPKPKKESNKKWLAIPAVLAVLAMAGWLFLGGDSDNKPTAASDKEDKVLAKDLGQRESGSIKLKIPDSVEAAQKLIVEWRGESASNDKILISKPDSQDNVSLQRANAGNGKQVEVQVPGTPGTYEVRYQDGSNRQIITREEIEVKAPAVSLTAAAEQAPGSEISVAWTAPNNKGDYLTIAEVDTEGNVYKTYSYTSKGSPTKIRVPDVPGQYELRYISSLDKAIWAAEKMRVLEPQLTFSLPDTVSAGAEIKIDWQGPGNKGDYFCVSNADDDPGQYVHYVYARAGKKTMLRMPEDPGEFEVRYMSGLSKQIWATQAVTVTMPEVSINTPESAVAGHEILIPWEGPANKGDYVTVAEAGTEGNEYLSYKYARAKDKSKTRLSMPDTPGEYVLRYISGSQRKIWAETAITITERSETLTVPDSAKAGERFNVSWTQKGFPREYIAVYTKGADVKSYDNYSYTNKKTSAKLKAPAEPGDYEVRYISAQDNLVWATAELRVE